MQEMAGDLIAVDRGQSEVDAPLALGLGAHVVGELEQVVAVGRHGIRRQASLALQVREKHVDALGHEPPRSVERESRLACIGRSTRAGRRPARACPGWAGRTVWTAEARAALGW